MVVASHEQRASRRAIPAGRRHSTPSDQRTVTSPSGVSWISPLLTFSSISRWARRTVPRLVSVTRSSGDNASKSARGMSLHLLGDPLGQLPRGHGADVSAEGNHALGSRAVVVRFGAVVE